MSDLEKLREMECPTCQTRGSLQLGERLVAKSFGTFSLAGAQTKTSAVSVPAIVCSTEGCGFYKLPSGWSA